MSRIEQAMEKAARMRQGTQVPMPAQAAATPFAAGSTVMHDPQERRDAPQPVTSTSPFLVNLTMPFSIAAEEFRKVKSALLDATKKGEFKNTLMVTSALPGEGKTVTSLNLAISLAEEYDHTVLLVEADLRRPTMHQYLSLEDRPGFSSCLLGEVDLRDAITPTGIGKLSIIRAGHSVPNPAELFSSQRTRNLIMEMKSRYPDRYIIFDTPPILSFTEARSLAQLVDSSLFVVMERHASASDIKESLEVLKGCPVLGVVYNGAEQVSRDKRYSYYHRYTEEQQAAKDAATV